MSMKAVYTLNHCLTFLLVTGILAQCLLVYGSQEPVLYWITMLQAFDLVGWLCFTSHRQQGHLEMAPPFTVPCEGREAQ